MNVDRNTLVEQNEGVRRDVSVGSEGYMKTRQNSSKPPGFGGPGEAGQREHRKCRPVCRHGDPARNAEKVLNSMQGGETQYGAIERSWGRAGRKYIQKAMADLSGSKGDSEVFDHLSSVLRGNASCRRADGKPERDLAAGRQACPRQQSWAGAEPVHLPCSL